MATAIDARLADLGVTLPAVTPPAGSYVPFLRTGDLLHVSGQISRDAGGLVTGRLGDDLDVAAGVAAARASAMALLAQVHAACDGDWDRLDQVVKLTGFVAAAPDFTRHPAVIDGASDLMVEILGEAGRHARSAVGVASLPLGVAVEIEGIFRLR